LGPRERGNRVHYLTSGDFKPQFAIECLVASNGKHQTRASIKDLVSQTLADPS
jgi:hypothetical protein